MNRTVRWCVLFAALTLPLLAQAAPVRIGSKVFTESVILGELAKATAGQVGVDAVHQRELGGTSILWKALQQGDIDVYSEYTGTITHELLKNVAPDADIPTLRERLKPLGVGITDSLGFNNTYAVGMLASKAAQLHIATLSDLVAHPELRFGFSNEFIDRADGWPGIRQRYGLPQTNVKGLDHALSYRAVASGAVDAIDLYSTDAEIPYYHLRTLTDDRHYFPRYEAVYLYRLALVQSAPAFVTALQKLAGRINENTMREMNAQVKLHGAKENVVVAGFLGIHPDSSDSNGLWSRLLLTSIDHIKLVALSLGLAVLLAIPLGIFAARLKRLGQLVIGLTGILQTVPSLAMFVFMIPVFGIGTWPAIAALFLYSLLPIVRNTATGLQEIPTAVRESAAALGLEPQAQLWKVFFPLASRTILAGVKTSAIIDVGTATLAALIGVGGLGEPIISGLNLNDYSTILQGAIPAALLALLVQFFFDGLDRVFVPKGLRLKQ